MALRLPDRRLSQFECSRRERGSRKSLVKYEQRPEDGRRRSTDGLRRRWTEAVDRGGGQWTVWGDDRSGKRMRSSRDSQIARVGKLADFIGNFAKEICKQKLIFC